MFIESPGMICGKFTDPITIELSVSWGVLAKKDLKVLIFTDWVLPRRP